MGKVVKKVKKAVKKVVKQVSRPVEKLAKGAVGALAGGVEVPDIQAPEPQAVAAQLAEVPDQKVETEDEAQTEAGRKKAARGGKKSLSVARSSGGGLNI